ncbi:hypothetical protein NA57DRAFT_76343 [Rhizodiscina lignyota]|uniref:Uncharacterized protein n=1 Tax=Rhizodiscina lignyota TaxID=1504668 RepID=A0A9P4IH67_9PEZI|nr:hypothetical protein NA57DRAFT_76343 [Rhizodiscina lignyota]
MKLYFYSIFPLFTTLATALSLRQAAPIGCQTCTAGADPTTCHPSTSCVSLGGFHTGNGPIPAYCACAAGYKADPMVVGADPAAQWRLPWAGQEGRVFVRPGTPCTVLCEEWYLGEQGCSEVPEYANCM